MYIDLLIQVKNASQARHDALKVRYTKMNYAILELLKKYKFVKKLEVKGRAYKKIVEVELTGAREIQGMKLLSRPSRRLYAPYAEFRKVKGGQGVLVVSTSQGIMAGHEARTQKVGGQLLFEIW